MVRRMGQSQLRTGQRSSRLAGKGRLTSQNALALAMIWNIWNDYGKFINGYVFLMVIQPRIGKLTLMGIQRHETSQTWKPLTFFCEAFDLWVRGIPPEMGWLVVELAKLCGPYPLVRWFVARLWDQDMYHDACAVWTPGGNCGGVSMIWTFQDAAWYIMIPNTTWYCMVFHYTTRYYIRNHIALPNTTKIY
jgi:hypothetical protein